MKLSIIILTWNSGKHIKQCLSSVRENIQDIEAEIIVIDNGSTDDSISILENEFPEAILIRNNVNRGVAPARNQGISKAVGEYIMILDIDTYMYSDTVKAMLAFMEENRRVGLCAPKLVFADGTPQKSCRRFPLVHMKVLRRIDTNWAKDILESENYTKQIAACDPFEVDYVIGACQLIRKSAVDKVGLLDDKIFYGPEDVDYCLRMWLNGYKVSFLPYVKIVHYEQRVTKSKILSKITIKHIAALIYFFCKYRYCFSRRKIYKKVEMAKNYELQR